MSAAYYCICEDGYVYPPNTPLNLPRILYRINTSFSRKTDSNTWYTAFVEDKTWQRVPGNVLEWRGIECRIEEEDDFVKSEEAKALGLAEDGVALVAHVKDKRNKEKRQVFPNSRRDGKDWVQLMAYVRDLDLLGTHDAVQRYRALRLG